MTTPTKQIYLGRIQLASGALRFSVDQGSPQALTLTAAAYWPTSYTGEGVDGLVEHIEAVIQAIGGAYATATCTLDLSTSKVTLDFDGVTTAVTWTDTTLRDYLGYDADLSGASSYVAPNECRFVWAPSNSATTYPVTLSEFWEVRSGTVVSQGDEGTSSGQEGGSAGSAIIRYDLLPRNDVLIQAGAGQSSNRSFERFLRDVAFRAAPIRALHDKSSYADTSDFVIGLFGRPDGSRIGGLRDWASPSYGESSHYLWDVTLSLCEYDGT